MPTTKYSTLALLLLDWKNPSGARPWDSDAVITNLEIGNKPAFTTDEPQPTPPPEGEELTTVVSAKLPKGISAANHQAFVNFISALRNQPRDPDARIKFIDQTNGPEDAGRTVWKNWFRGISGKVNKIVEETMTFLECHPAQLLYEFADDPTFTWPSGSNYGARCADAIGREVFGDALLSLNGHAFPTAHPFLCSIGTVNYDRLKKAYGRSTSDKIPKARETAMNAMEKLNQAKSVRLTDLNKAQSALNAYDKTARWHPQEQDQIEEYKATLEPFGRRRGRRLSARYTLGRRAELTAATGRAKGKGKVIWESDLADIDAVNAAWGMFVSHFTELRSLFDKDVDVGSTVLMDAIVDEVFNDMGTETMCQKSLDELQYLLGYLRNRPARWAKVRHRDPTKTSWDDGADLSQWEVTLVNDAGNTELPKEGMDLLGLLWHQQVGIASMADKSFTKVKTQNVPGIILADAVGVGKTAQMLGMVAFLQQTYVVENPVDPAKREPRPPIIADRPFFMGTGPIPDYPLLFVIPNTCCDQFHREVKAFFQPGTVDIFRFPTASAQMDKFFLRPPYTDSKHKEINRFVICPASALQTATGMIFDVTSFGRRGIVDTQRKPKNPTAFKTSIFGKSYTTVWFDEAHEYRGTGRAFIGALHLRFQSRFVGLASGTPLYTKPSDIINLARIGGFEAFCGEEGLELEREGVRSINRARKALTWDDKKAITTRQEQLFRGIDSEIDDPSIEHRATQYSFIRQLRELLDNHLIRRNAQSKKPDGTPINPLPPLHIHPIAIILTDEEMALLMAEMGRMKEDRKETLSAVEWTSENFFTGYRTLIAYPSEDIDAVGTRLWKPFANIDAWNAKRGTKLQTAIDIMKHNLGHDDALPCTTNDEGELTCPPHPSTPPRNTRKAMLFFEYSMMLQTIQSAFRVNGINTYAITGQMNLDQRASVINEFVTSTDPEWRVLLFSSVGIAGLNLACADVLILYDVVWSKVTVTQIIGRAHRMGQKKPVHVYELMALGTTDAVMATLAAGKDMMLNALLSKHPNKELESFLAEDVAGDDNDDLISLPGSETSKTSSSKRKPTTRAAAKTKEPKLPKEPKVAKPKEPKVEKPKVAKTKAAPKGKGKGKAKAMEEDVIDEPAIDEDVGAEGTVEPASNLVASFPVNNRQYAYYPDAGTSQHRRLFRVNNPPENIEQLVIQFGIPTTSPPDFGDQTRKRTDDDGDQVDAAALQLGLEASRATKRKADAEESTNAQAGPSKKAKPSTPVTSPQASEPELTSTTQKSTSDSEGQKLTGASLATTPSTDDESKHDEELASGGEPEDKANSDSQEGHQPPASSLENANTSPDRHAQKDMTSPEPQQVNELPANDMSVDSHNSSACQEGHEASKMNIDRDNVPPVTPQDPQRVVEPHGNQPSIHSQGSSGVQEGHLTPGSDFDNGDRPQDFADDGLPGPIANMDIDEEEPDAPSSQQYMTDPERQSSKSPTPIPPPTPAQRRRAPTPPTPTTPYGSDWEPTQPARPPPSDVPMRSPHRRQRSPQPQPEDGEDFHMRSPPASPSTNRRSSRLQTASPTRPRARGTKPSVSTSSNKDDQHRERSIGIGPLPPTFVPTHLPVPGRGTCGSKPKK